MSKIDEKLSTIFDVDSHAEENLPVEVKQGEIISVEDNNIESDFNRVRSNINNLIEKGNTAIDNLLHVAKETEHPRAYEVAANLLKTMSDLNKDLLDIRKKKKELTGETPVSNAPLIDKAVFVGSTDQLIDLIKEKK
jgi:hypothetical protein